MTTRQDTVILLARGLLNDAADRGDLDWRTVRWVVDRLLLVAEDEQDKAGAA